MIHKLAAFTLALLLTLSLASCAEPSIKSPADYDFTRLAAEWVDYTVPPIIHNPAAFEVDDDGNVYVSVGRVITRYKPDGEIKTTYYLGQEFGTMSYHDGYLYCFTRGTWRLTRVDTGHGFPEDITDNLELFFVSGVEAVDGAVYLTATTELPTDSVSHLNVIRHLYKIDTKSGEMTEIEGVGNPVSLYKASDGKLYIYSKADGEYVLYEYNTKRDEAKELTVIDGIENVNMFAYEYGSFVAATLFDVKAMAMPDGEPYTVETINTVYTDGMKFAYHGGNILFFENTGDGALLRILKVGEHIILTSSTGEPSVEEIGAITITDPSYYGQNEYIDTEELYKRTGIYSNVAFGRTTTAVRDNTSNANSNSGLLPDYDEMNEALNSLNDINAVVADNYELALMAGDDEVDIYLVPRRESNVLNTLLSDGGYEPLNDNEIISNYIDGCFDWVADAVTAPNGDIAMFPLYFELPVIWYSPENMEKFGVSADDLSTFDKYYETIERLNGEKGDYWIYNSSDTLKRTLKTQYESLFLDMDNKTADYNTDLYKQIIDMDIQAERTEVDSDYTYKDRVIEWSQYIFMHPVLEYDRIAISALTPAERVAAGSYAIDLFGFISDRIIFSLFEVGRELGISMAEEFPDNPYVQQVELFGDSAPSPITDWRVLPPPRVSEEITTNIFTEYMFALVNPNSKNKELAMKYLEEIAKDPYALLEDGQFIYEDKAMYEGYYDMSQPVFQDLYDIYANGEVYIELFEGEDGDIVQDCLNGRITLDEAVAEIDRRAKIFAGE